MVATAINKGLTTGLYTPSEAAFYGMMRPQLVHRWFFGTQADQPVIRRELADEKERFVTFLDFTQAMTVRNLRLRESPKVSLSAIRDVLQTAEARGITYPFARRHQVFIVPSGDLVLKVEDEMIDTKHGHREQTYMRPLIEPHMQDVHYDADGLASRLLRYRWSNVDIVMEPGKRFGVPVLAKSTYTAETIAQAVEAEGSVDAVVGAYGVSRDEVMASMHYIDSLRTAG